MKPIKPQKKFITMGIAFSLLLLACFSIFFAFLSLNTDFTLRYSPNFAGMLVESALVFIFLLAACLCFIVSIIFFASIFHRS